MSPRLRWLFVGVLVFVALAVAVQYWTRSMARQQTAGDIALEQSDKTDSRSVVLERFRPQRGATQRERSADATQTDEQATAVFLSGNVCDENKKPLAGVRVAVNNAIVRQPTEAHIKTALTDSAGNYRIELRGRIPSLWRLNANHAEYAPLPGAFTAETTAPVWNATLRPFSTISGVVRTNGGIPIARAKVWGRPAELSSNFERMTKPCTDEVVTAVDGTFVLNNVPQNMPVSVAALPTEPGWTIGMSIVRSVPATDVVVIPQLGGGAVRGTVVNELDAPVAGSHVMMISERGAESPRVCSTDEQGGFAFAGVAMGRILMFASGRNRYNSDRSETLTFTLANGETTEGVMLHFHPVVNEITVAPTLVDDAQRPVANCAVTVRWVNPDGKTQQRQCTSEANGTFECPGVNADEYDLMFKQDGILPAEKQEAVKVLKSHWVRRIPEPIASKVGSRDEFRVVVERVPVVTVTAIDRTELPVAGAVVYLADGFEGRRLPPQPAVGTARYSVPSSVADNSTLVFVAVSRTGAGSRDCLLGTAECTVRQAREVRNLELKILLSKPQYWGAGKFESDDPAHFGPLNRIYPAFRRPTAGETAHKLYLNELAVTPDKAFEFPILPGYECGVGFAYIEMHPDGTGQRRNLADAWLLPEEWVGKQKTFRFDPVLKALTTVH